MPERRRITDRLARICLSSSWVLSACLLFAVPFGPARNSDMQAYLLIVAGVFSWVALFLRRDTHLQKRYILPICIFFGSAFLSTLFNPHVGYDLVGAPYARLGLLELISCLGLGLTLLSLPLALVTRGLYLAVAAVAVCSLPYALLHAYGFTRLGGLFSQADIMGAFLAAGLLLGTQALRAARPKEKPYFIALQVYMAILLFMTNTRAAIILCTLLYPLAIQASTKKIRFQHILIFWTGAVLLFGGLHTLLPHRLSDTRYASESISYRKDLQASALAASFKKPILGYGSGNLADALDCRDLTSRPLLKTCREGYFFNSSHNIFLDRILATGWAGGLAFISFCAVAIYAGFRNRQTRILAYTALLVSLYYLTNVTSVPLELLLWIVLLQCTRVSRA